MADAEHAVVIREARIEDCVPVCGVLRSLGLTVPEAPEAARQLWQRLWIENPAVATTGKPLPIGWVLESGARIVGFFGNIPQRFQLGDQSLRVAVASQWGVEKPFRGSTNALATAYFSQAGADVLLVTTGIRPTGRLFERFGATVMPQREYDEVLFWVIDPARFAAATLRKRDVSPGLAKLAAGMVSPMLAVAVALQRHRPGRLCPGLEPEAIALAEVGDEFDDLWRRKLSERRRFYASRTSADLRWHLGPHERSGALTLLRCRRAGRLEGYLVLVREHVTALGLVRTKIVDLVAKGDDVDIVGALLAAAGEASRAAGAAAIELVGFPSSIRDVAASGRPFSRSLPTSPYYYKACSPALETALAPPDVWYPTFFDGDSSL